MLERHVNCSTKYSAVTAVTGAHQNKIQTKQQQKRSVIFINHRKSKTDVLLLHINACPLLHLRKIKASYCLRTSGGSSNAQLAAFITPDKCIDFVTVIN